MLYDYCWAYLHLGTGVRVFALDSRFVGVHEVAASASSEVFVENQTSVNLRPFLLQPSSYQVWVQAIARSLYEAGHGSTRFFMPSKTAIIAYHRASSRLHFQCFMEITIEAKS